MPLKLLLFAIFPLVLFASGGNHPHSNRNHPHFTDPIFTQQELVWLDKKQTLAYVYDPDWAPFEWKNDINTHTGIIADIMSILGERTGIEFIPRHTDTWKESVDLVKSEEVPMFSAITQNSAREEYLDFTDKDIFTYPAVLVTPFDTHTVYLDMDKDAKNKTIGIILSSGLGQYIPEYHPDLNYVSITSTQEGFEKLRDKEIDLFAINAITARYYIEKKHFSDMKIALKLNYLYHLKMAVHKNAPEEIATILTKGLAGISEHEINHIFQKWISREADKELGWMLAGEITGVLFLLMIFWMTWYNKVHSAMYNLLYAKHQAQIEKNELLLDENRQFIADMVHQIRTPLSVIMANSSLIEMKVKNKVDSYLAQINSSINMLSSSYEDLSYIIANDTLTYKPIKIDLSDFLNRRISFFTAIIEANDKTISSDIPSDIEIFMNDTELERLIDNNLSNAIKHSSKKSEIKIILEKSNADIVLKFITGGENIRDTSKIFDKNYTEGSLAKRSLGLGLNIVKTICEKNHIHYSVCSEENTNTFTYIFKV